jgi:hypothetical protein
LPSFARCIWKLTLPNIARQGLVHLKSVTPGIAFLTESAACRALPLRLSWQADPGPGAVGLGVMPGNVYAGLLLGRRWRAVPATHGRPVRHGTVQGERHGTHGRTLRRVHRMHWIQAGACVFNHTGRQVRELRSARVVEQLLERHRVRASVQVRVHQVILTPATLPAVLDMPERL